jgi:mannose/fructose/N-acetylgalactosamine-specific phosphotransferase system component IID
MKIFINRMLRAAKLDVNLYEEVAVDSDSLNQSILIIILSSLAAGIGGITTGGILLFIFGTIVVLISWLLWAYLTFIIGTKLLHTKETRVDWGDIN